MVNLDLTESEARVLWTVLHNAYAPSAYYADWTSALRKLCQIGGGYACRDCSGKGTKASRFGGFVCAEHKAKEDALLTQETKQ